MVRLIVSTLSLLTVVTVMTACRDRSHTVSTPTQSKNYQLPSEIFLDAIAERGSEGEIYISGTTNLPDGMRIGVEIPDVKWKETIKDPQGRSRTVTIWSQDLKLTIQSGRFRSRGMTAGRHPYAAGKHKVDLLAIFNGAWQSKEILKITGEGGKNLHGKLFKKRDPDVVDSDLELDYPAILIFPPLSLESQAINLVQAAVITVPGQGRSATNIQENIKFFMKMPVFHRVKVGQLNSKKEQSI